MLDPGVDALLHISVSDALVDNDSDGGLGHVVDNTGLAVVDLVWHTMKRLHDVSAHRSSLSWGKRFF